MTRRQERLARAIADLSAKDMLQVMDITATNASASEKWDRSRRLLKYAEDTLKYVENSNGVDK